MGAPLYAGLFFSLSQMGRGGHTVLQWRPHPCNAHALSLYTRRSSTKHPVPRFATASCANLVPGCQVLTSTKGDAFTWVRPPPLSCVSHHVPRGFRHARCLKEVLQFCEFYSIVSNVESRYGFRAFAQVFPMMTLR